MPSKTKLLGAVVLLLAGSTGPAPAQESAREPIVYRREVFQYQRSARPDPFRSLLNAAELGVRLEDLTLRGVVHNPDPRQSVAIFSVVGSDRPIRARVGERVGGLTVAAIQPRRVDILITEFGVTRRETLQLKTVSDQGTES